MPFIKGRYHINPILGEALEAAREAESALQELEQEESDNGGKKPKAPVRKVEIEAAEMVPSHSGRGQRGYIARLHRQAVNPRGNDPETEEDDCGEDAGNARSGVSRGYGPTAGKNAQPETHIFENPGDLMSFLQSELGGNEDE